MKRIFLLLVIGGTLVAMRGQAAVSWTPWGTANASYGYVGMNPIYNYFHLPQSVRVTTLGYMEAQPNDPAPLVISLWRGTPGNLTALAAATVYTPPGQTNFGVFALADNGYGGFLNGNPVPPVILPPGDYAISARVVDNTQNLHHFYYVTTDFTLGNAVSTASASSFGSGNVYIGPAFAYEAVPEPPVLQFTVTGGELKLLWPLTATNAVLQVATNLAEGNGWTDAVADIPGTNGTNYSVSLPMTNAAAYFRLRQ